MAAQPLSFVDSSYKEPSAWAGSDLQVQNDLVLRPRIGGFYPSVMQGVVDGGRYLAPLAALTGRRMFTSKKGGGKKEDWARNRERARAELQQYGNPSGVNVNKYAAYVRKNSRAAAAFLDDFRERKARGPKKAAARAPARKEEPRLQRNLKRQAQENSNAAMREYKKLISRRKPRSPPSPPRAPAKTRKVGWANQLRAAAETIRQFEKAHPGIKRTKGNFTTLASLRRRGLNDRDFFDRYGSPPAPAETRKNKNRFSPYRRKAVNTLRNLKKKYPDLKRKAGNFMTLGKLFRDGDVGKQQEFLKTFGLPDSNVLAATQDRRQRPPSSNEVERAFAAAVPIAPAARTRRKMTRNEYWAAYRQANANLKTRGIAKPKPENKRRLVESRRLGLNNTNVASAAAPVPVSVSAAATRKRSPVRNANKETAKARLMSVGPQGAKGPSAAQTLQFARMVKNGRENSMEQFLRNYAAKKAATAAKRAPRDSSV